MDEEALGATQRGLRKPSTRKEELEEYLPQGSVGCVALDAGHCIVRDAYGGLTNKIPERIGDTPTLGAGFWAEEWGAPGAQQIPPSIPRAGDGAGSWWQDFSLAVSRRWWPPAVRTSSTARDAPPRLTKGPQGSGTLCNGGYFLRLSAASVK